MLTPDQPVADTYRDPAQAARDAGLRYVTDEQPGLTRRRVGSRFTYFDAAGQRIRDEKTLARIASFVIPPAWEDVWIAPTPMAHLQVTGRDARGRKQYRYHPKWQATRAETKFDRLHRFGAEALPKLRARVAADLARRSLDRARVLAIVVRLMEHSFIRVGNQEYARQNKSFGLTTLRDRHVTVTGSEIKLAFVGKKGVEHQITVQDRRLARLVKRCQDIPGQHLFQYYDEAGQRCPVDSADVNAYLREATGDDFTAKDFRTWGGTVRMVECLEAQLQTAPDLSVEKTLRLATQEVARHLGNTPTVCAKYYIHPQVMAWFKDGKLLDFLRTHDAQAGDDKDLLTPTEHLVLRMLS